VIWRDSLNDYLGRLNVPEIPDQLESIGRLHAHTLATDPDRFAVAVRPGHDDSEEIVAFASAVERGGVWFLSMLFVAPREQTRGLGRRLLDRTRPEAGPGHPPGAALAAVTDSAQPISNGLYASYGIVPRLPLAHLVGRPGRREALPRLPAGLTVEPLMLEGELEPDVHRLDREVLGYEHPADHRFAIDSGRRPHRLMGGDGAFLGYGYASPVGLIGPIAVRDASLLAPFTAHLLGVVEPRGALAAWVPGDATETFSTLIRSGFRIDGFPLLIGWSRPFADFSRYVPLSPGLL
jgi:GNAT superfamily N-acetyltransferase